MDEINRKILKILQKNAREPIIRISKSVGLSDDAVRYRLAKMEKLGLILGYRAILNAEALGLEFTAIILVGFGGYSKEEKKRFVDFVSELRNVVFFQETVGEWDCVIVIRSEDRAGYGKIADEIRENFMELVKEWKVLYSIKSHKEVSV